MFVFISVDMEGVAGVAHRDQVWRGTDVFAEACRLMEDEANAAVDGAFAAGATRVVVNDSHGDMYNLSPTRIDERAELQIGSPKVPGGMIHRADEADVAVFVGYHAPAGTPDAVLDHTFSSLKVHDVRLNDRVVGEAELNAVVLGAAGVPVALLTGDDRTCAFAADYIPGLKTLAVKEGAGNRTARSLHPSEACRRIQQATHEALTGPLPDPLVVEAPLRLEITFHTTLSAEVACVVPGATRTDGRTVAYEARDVQELGRARASILGLGSLG